MSLHFQLTFTFDPNLEFNYSKLFRCFTLSRFHIFNFSGLRFLKKSVFVFCRFASICNTENIREGQSQLLGPFRQSSEKNTEFFRALLERSEKLRLREGFIHASITAFGQQRQQTTSRTRQQFRNLLCFQDAWLTVAL